MPRKPPAVRQRVPFTPTKRAFAAGLRKAGWTFSEIAAEPQLRGVKKDAIRKGLKRVASHSGDFYYNGRKEHSGRKASITTEDLELADLELQDPDNNIANGEDLRRELWPDIPARTVRHNLHKFGLKGFAQRQKLPLRETHVNQREAMYHKYKHWTEENVFARGVVINTDETKIHLSTSDGKQWCRRRTGQDTLNPKFVQQEERHGRFGTSLCVWGGIHLGGVTPLIRVEGNLDRFQYVEILKEGLLPLYDEYDTRVDFRPTFLLFQQDNDPKHTSRYAKDFLRDEGIDVMQWAAKSPDMSPVENCWAELKVRIRKHRNYRHAKTDDDLWEMAQDVWNSESFKQYAIHCYNSFPRRFEALKANNFLWVKY